ncbi:MAG: hypothetical protein LBJ11_08140 [Oscillospiraceae bacterium]|jgi:division/cell wall cluster transcriptional repressor MraZ|nr:hypothetical protein [Oscillospiraceae bacterium]
MLPKIRSAEGTLDSKSRLTLPQPFRDELGKTFVLLQPLARDDVRCLCLYAEEAYEALYNDHLAQLPPGAREEYERLSALNVTGVGLDAQYRFLIPSRMEKWAGMDKDRELRFLHSGNRIEIWTQSALTERETKPAVSGALEAIRRLSLTVSEGGGP